MKTINISTFKTRCIALLKDVQKSREPMIVTLRGKPLARIEPPDAGGNQKDITLGALKGSVVICGDIIYTDSSDEWQMNSP